MWLDVYYMHLYHMHIFNLCSTYVVRRNLLTLLRDWPPVKNIVWFHKRITIWQTNERFAGGEIRCGLGRKLNETRLVFSQKFLAYKKPRVSGTYFMEEESKYRK